MNVPTGIAIALALLCVTQRPEAVRGQGLKYPADAKFVCINDFDPSQDKCLQIALTCSECAALCNRTQAWARRSGARDISDRELSDCADVCAFTAQSWSRNATDAHKIAALCEQACTRTANSLKQFNAQNLSRYPFTTYPSTAHDVKSPELKRQNHEIERSLIERTIAACEKCAAEVKEIYPTVRQAATECR